MSKGASPPPAPNAAATAAAQEKTNIGTAAASQALNLIGQNTPYGTTAYSPSGSYTIDGQTVPTYTENVNLSPLSQEMLTGQQNLGLSELPVARNLVNTAGQVSTQPLPNPNLLDQNATNAVYQQEQSYLDPSWNLQQQQLQDQLSRQGIGVGSDAYDSAMTNFNNSKNQAYQGAMDTAIGQGAQNASTLFGMAQAQQQQPISLLGSLLNATPQTPTQPISQPSQTSINPADYLGAQALQTSAQQQDYQAQLAQQNATFGGLASLGGAGLMALMMSDPRVKEIGDNFGSALDLLDEVPVFIARYKGEDVSMDRPMIMATDLKKVLPQAVVGGSGDILMIKPADLIPVLIGAVRELSARVRELEGR